MLLVCGGHVFPCAILGGGHEGFRLASPFPCGRRWPIFGDLLYPDFGLQPRNKRVLLSHVAHVALELFTGLKPTE